jgi:hypothetical protein
MNKLIGLLVGLMLMVSACAQQQNLTEEEREKFRRSQQRYDAGQTR